MYTSVNVAINSPLVTSNTVSSDWAFQNADWKGALLGNKSLYFLLKIRIQYFLRTLPLKSSNLLLKMLWHDMHILNTLSSALVKCCQLKMLHVSLLQAIINFVDMIVSYTI